jgi:hypothetical protein
LSSGSGGTPKKLADSADLADHGRGSAGAVCRVFSRTQQTQQTTLQTRDLLPFLRQWFRGTAGAEVVQALREVFWCEGDIRDPKRRYRGPISLLAIEEFLRSWGRRFSNINVLLGVGFWTDPSRVVPEEGLMRYDRLFYDFDSEVEPETAREVALEFAESLRRVYGATPVVVDSGFKGAHVYIFLSTPTDWRGYRALWEYLLSRYCGRPELADRNVLKFNWVARVPYTYNIKENRRALARVVYPREVEPKDFDISEIAPLDTSKLRLYVLEGIELPQVVEVGTRSTEGGVVPVRPKDPAELVSSETTPPCVKSWIQELTTTGDLDHYQRVNLVLFLKALGYGVEECVELFRRYAKDFSERVTRYQVEYLYGLRGRRVDWRPYGCAKLGEMGLCPGCGWRGSPVTYYLKHARRAVAQGT